MAVQTYHAISRYISRAGVFRLLHRLLPDDLNPIPIRVQRKRNMPHLSILELLFEPVPSTCYPCACSLDIVHTDTHMAKPAKRLFVAIVDSKLGVRLCAVVVCKLDEAGAVKEASIGGSGGGRIVAKEVEVESGLGKLELFEQSHAEKFIKLDGTHGILDAEHGVVEFVLGRVGSGRHGCVGFWWYEMRKSGEWAMDECELFTIERVQRSRCLGLQTTDALLQVHDG